MWGGDPLSLGDPAPFPGQSAGRTTQKLPAAELGTLGYKQQSQGLRGSAHLPPSPSRSPRPSIWSSPGLQAPYPGSHITHSIQLTGALVYFGRITSRVSFRRFTIDQSNSLFRHLAASSLAYVCCGSGQRKAWWVVNTSVSFTPSDWAVMHVLSFYWIAMFVNHVSLTTKASDNNRRTF